MKPRPFSFSSKVEICQLLDGNRRSVRLAFRCNQRSGVGPSTVFQFHRDQTRDQNNREKLTNQGLQYHQ